MARDKSMPRERKPPEVSILYDEGSEIAGGSLQDAASLVRTAADLRRKGKRVSVVLRQDIRWRPDHNEWEWEEETIVDCRKCNGSLPFFSEDGADAQGFALGLKLAGATGVRVRNISYSESAHAVWRVYFRLPQLDR